VAEPPAGQARVSAALRADPRRLPGHWWRAERADRCGLAAGRT